MWHSRSLLHTLRWLLHTTVSSPQPAYSRGCRWSIRPSLKCINYPGSIFTCRCSHLPGKYPVPAPAAPGLIPAPAGTYTPGEQVGGGGNRSESATLTKGDFPQPNSRFFLNKNLTYVANMINFSPRGPRRGEAGARPICRLGQPRSNEAQPLSRDQN